MTPKPADVVEGPGVRAFRTVAVGVTSIVFAESAPKARFATLRAAMGAGYRPKYTEVTAKRAREYDCRRTIQGNIPVQNAPLATEYLATNDALPAPPTPDTAL